uniref:Putative ovule protein n=1 Tax=Solanum chacoense TaxID=4108 RepID=A0A0V0GL43_SOLCH
MTLFLRKFAQRKILNLRLSTTKYSLCSNLCLKCLPPKNLKLLKAVIREWNKRVYGKLKHKQKTFLSELEELDRSVCE